MAYGYPYKQVLLQEAFSDKDASNPTHLSTSNDFSVLHLNVRSIKQNLNCINHYFSLFDVPDILLFSETWSTTNDVHLYIPDNFTLITFYCRKDFIRGGVSIFCKASLNLNFKTYEIPHNLDKVFECCVCYAKIGTKYIVFMTLYRSPIAPTNTFLTLLDQTLSNIFTKFGFDSTYIVGGDLNINFLINSVDSKLLFDILNSYGFNLNYNEPTRVQGSCRSGIDYLISTIASSQSSVCVVRSNISDHFHQMLTFSKALIGITNSTKEIKLTKRIFSTKNFNMFNTKISQVKLLTNNFYNIFLNIFNTCFPLTATSITTNKRKITYSPYLKNFSEYLRDLHASFKCSNCPLSDEYKALVKKFKYDLSQERINFNNNKIMSSKNKSKTTWNIINDTIKTKNNKPNIKLSIDNIIISDYDKIVNCFLNTFLPINNISNTNNIRIFPSVEHCMFLYPTDPFEVKRIIQGLPNSASVGPDEIPTSVIKSCADIICIPLSCLINDTFLTGVFPSEFKIAKIVPLYKKGSKTDPLNYRPLVIQNIFSKIIEKALTIRLVNYLIKYKLINDSQYAYMKGKSVELAIFNFLNAIYESLDGSLKCIGIFYDFSKAFDRVDHNILFSKLSSLGVTGTPLELIKSYLHDRQYFVQLSHTDEYGNTSVHRSDVRVWNEGVPQGSNLGPYLFLVMINDLPSHLTHKLLSMFANNSDLILSLYADDVNSIISNKNFKTLENICNYSIHVLVEWCKANKLTLNTDKTSYIYFSSVYNKYDVPDISLKIDDTCLTSSDSTVFLGLRMDTHLDWSNHIDKLCNKISSGIYALGRLRNEVSVQSLRAVYYAHIYSHIRSNIIFWGYCSDACRIFVLQKRAIRTIFGVQLPHSCAELFKNLRVLTMPSIYIFECVMFVRKNLHLFSRNCDRHVYNTRNSDSLSVFQHTKALFEKCPRYRMVHIYNKLPSDIKCIEKHSTFKKSLFQLLLKRNLYSISDF